MSLASAAAPGTLWPLGPLTFHWLPLLADAPWRPKAPHAPRYSLPHQTPTPFHAHHHRLQSSLQSHSATKTQRSPTMQQMNLRTLKLYHATLRTKPASASFSILSHPSSLDSCYIADSSCANAPFSSICPQKASIGADFAFIITCDVLGGFERQRRKVCCGVRLLVVDD